MSEKISLHARKCGPKIGPGCVILRALVGDGDRHVFSSQWERILTTESVESAALALERVHHVHGSDSLSLGVLCVCDGIPDDILQEHLEHTSRLFVDETGDTLDAASTSQTTDGGLGDALDVVT